MVQTAIRANATKRIGVAYRGSSILDARGILWRRMPPMPITSPTFQKTAAALDHALSHQRNAAQPAHEPEHDPGRRSSAENPKITALRWAADASGTSATRTG